MQDMATNSMDNEFERYKRLLGDWDKGQENAPPPPSPINGGSPNPADPDDITVYNLDSAGAELSTSRPVSPKPAAAAHEQTEFESGNILCLNNEDLVVYRRPIAGKPLDMVYSLVSDGSVRIDGVDLSNHDVVEVGALPMTAVKQIQREMTWNREMIANHCYTKEDGDRIPAPGGAVAASGAEVYTQNLRTPQRRTPGRPAPSAPAGGNSPELKAAIVDLVAQESAVRVEELPPTTPARPTPGKTKIRRGQKVKLKMKGRNWEAVYWGRDNKGSVVAHNSKGHWALVHFNLSGYKDALTISREADPALVEEIKQALQARKKQEQ